MIRIAICDDMPDQVSLITTLTKRYFKNKNVSDFSYKTLLVLKFVVKFRMVNA